MSAAPAASGIARIGPNAVIQAAKAIEAFESQSMLARVFSAAQLPHYLAEMPAAMIPEQDVIALHASLRADLGDRRAQSIAWTAGYHTANYILAHRIPKPAQMLLRHLPARLAAPLLVKAIARHAWTFAGSGVFSTQSGKPLVLSISNCPVGRTAHTEAPACGFYAATFERLFAELVAGSTRVTEIECQAMGCSACRFRVEWS
jgi:divinyl protochlorophyllide a 8-vinyl-reductase